MIRGHRLIFMPFYGQKCMHYAQRLILMPFYSQKCIHYDQKSWLILMPFYGQKEQKINTSVYLQHIS